MPRPGVGTLLRVDLQFEAPFDEAGQGRRDPPAGLLAADVGVTVIRVPHEPVAAMPKRAISSSNSESNRNIPNLPGVLGDGAIGGEPTHTGDVQQSGFAPALRRLPELVDFSLRVAVGLEIRCHHVAV